MLETRIRKLEALARKRQPRRLLVVYENDWRDDRPYPAPEELAAPDVDVLTIRYVADWPPPACPPPAPPTRPGEKGTDHRPL